MAVTLFAHNQKAYQSVEAMLARTGKVAVVHPTGTGKSFIAFKLIEDNPNKTFLWLSPSEYIFKTQCESVQRDDPAFPLQNVTFMTYARLIQYTAEELDTLRADYIILDEFHRCGAEQWGAGVNALLAANPQAKLLGLTATAVRYLDGCKDMAEALFSGNIASEMTLGEAIVRGILPAPVYVTTVFKYQNELAKYQAKVNSVRGAGLRAQNQQYLEALRRALEQADGLDIVFQKRLTNKTGKYIVFCSGLEHMKEMQSHVPEWFGRVNSDIHTYTAYSADPETSRALAGFKADESGALKLLFCIDMLNEGIHVRGISGVILFRPTVSPIIYKQQIGRALTAGDSAAPLILDVVNNFDGLCSIAGLQQEMTTAVQQMYRTGEGGQVVTERFTVIEQVKDCRLLFEQLQNSLSGNWEQYFAAASLYYAEHGDLNVPKRYKTPAGLSLGEWLGTQRRVRAGQCPGSLTEAQVARLDGIGMVWENRLETAWEKGFSHAEAYKAAFGDLLVPVQYESADGFRLGAWIANLRQQRANGQRSNTLTPERIARLDGIGMVWDVLSVKWEQNYLEALKYYQRFGDLMVPAAYKTENGFALGKWVRDLRRTRLGKTRSRTLSEEQIKRLDAIGMYWGDCNDNQWLKGYRAAERYYKQNGDLNMPVAYQSPDGIALGKWVRRQRYAVDNQAKTDNHMAPERIRMLRQIGMDLAESAG